MTRTGQLIRRGDRTWLVRVPIGRDSKTTARRYHNETVHGTKRDAERVLNNALRKRDLGTLVEPARVPVGEYLDRWLEDVARPRIRERTHRDYRFLIDRYIRPYIGAQRLDRLSPADVQAMIATLTAGERDPEKPERWRRRPLSPKTIRHAHAVLSTALTQAMRWEMLSRNVASLVELPRLRPREMRSLSREEADQFRAAIRGERFEALFLLLLGTGVRPSEALAFTWDDLDVEGARATVRRVLPRDQKGEPRFEEPKTARSRRTVPLSPSVVRALRTHRAAQAKERLAASAVYSDNDLVFASLTGGPLDERNVVHRHFKPALRRAKLPEATRLYDLRHCHVTLSLRAGEPVHVVSARVGHASARMTLDVYAHALPADESEAPARLEAALFGG